MAESVTVEYRPLNKGNIIHTRKLQLTREQLFGLMIAAKALLSSDRIIIKLQDGGIADISKINDLPYISGDPKSFTYTGEIGHIKVMFNGIELIQGALQLCILLGMDPTVIITDIKYQGISTKLGYNYHYSVLSIPNFTNYPNGHVIHLDKLKKIISSKLIDTISLSLKECFPESQPAMIIPSEFYMMTSDEDHQNIIASVASSLYLPNSVSKYKYLNAYYIYNVCANIKYRGQGLTKSIMITMLNGIISKGHDRFLLEVAPNNTVAYTLYTSLGFKKIDTVIENNKQYDILYLDSSI